MKGKCFTGKYSHVNVVTSGRDKGKLNFAPEDQIRITFSEVIGKNISLLIEYDFSKNNYNKKNYAYGLFTNKNSFEFIQENGYGNGILKNNCLFIRFYDNNFNGNKSPGGNFIKLISQNNLKY